MTSKRAFTIWILIVFTFFSGLGLIHAWTSWQAEGTGYLVTFFSLGSFGFQMETSAYFILTFVITILFVGAICFKIFRNESIEIPLRELSLGFEKKLEDKSQEIKDSTNEALTKLGLREFQLKESFKALHMKLESIEKEMNDTLGNHISKLESVNVKLTKIERKLVKVGELHKELPKLKNKLQSLEVIQEELRKLEKIIKRIDSIPEPYLNSTDDIRVLEGKVLKRTTVMRLKQDGIEKLEDLLLKNPIEIAKSKAMSESEAKNLQSILQLLMVRGVKHEDAVLLLESGISSKQELALQDAFNLGARVARTAELFIIDGKLEEREKPTLEDVSSWIKWAKQH